MNTSLDRRRFLRMLSGGIAASATLGIRCGVTKSQQNKSPNVVLFFADDLGYGDLSCYGHPTIRTPHLDQMAREGVRLTSFYATAPVCTPSRVALLTGRYPVRTGQYNNLGPESVGGLSLSEVLIPQLLKTKGYKTMAIGKWHIGHNPVEHMPTSRGFDSYYGLLYSNDMIRPFTRSELPMHLFRDTTAIEKHPVEQTTLTERYTNEAVNFIKKSKDHPFFLYIPHSMPHLPVSTSAKFVGKSRAGRFGDVIETIDWSVGQVLKTLKEEGLDENTIVIFTSDNGPWQHLPDRMLQKGNERWHAGTAGLLRGHKATTYEGGMRVPFIVRWPNKIPAGEIREDIACTMDLYTTIAQTAGAEVPSDRFVDGKNILNFLQCKEPSPRTEFFYFRSRSLEAVRLNQWKLRISRQRDDKTMKDKAEIELYNLDVDPMEKYNVADRHVEIVTKLRERMKAMAKELEADMDDV